MKTLPSRTIFISAFHMLASRNVLCTDVLKTLSNKENLNLIVFVRSYKEKFMRDTYGCDNIKIIGINEEQLPRSLCFKLFCAITPFLLPTYTIILRARERLYRRKGILSYFEFGLNYFLSKFLSRFKFIKNSVRFLDYYLFQKNFVDDYVKKCRPDCILVTDVFYDMDVLFLQSAKSHNITSLGMVRSWDNTTTKGLMRIVPDKLIVNNAIIKSEAVRLHNINSDNIFIGGIPQFDLSLHGYHILKEEFLKKIGADLNKKLILFAPAGSILSDTDWQLCELLKYGIDQKLIPPNIQFLIRQHPICLDNCLDKFASNQNFIIEKPGTKFSENKFKGTEFHPDDLKHLVNSIFHSEMVIYVNSTIGIDSLPFNKPQIMIEFDGWENKPYIDSVKRYHDEDHMKKYINTGAVKIVKNQSELFYWINQYLNNPEIDSDKRQIALEQYLYKLDGCSGRRIGEFIINQVF